MENKIKTGRCFTWAHRGMRPNKRRRRRVDGRLMLNKDRTKRERALHKFRSGRAAPSLSSSKCFFFLPPSAEKNISDTHTNTKRDSGR